MDDFPEQFKARGFLADAFVDLSPKLREANSRWFEMAEGASAALNRCVARAMDRVEGRSLSREVIATLIGARACGTFQGAILLSARAMIVEARTFLRSCVEAEICLAALHEDPDEFARLLKLDDSRSRKAQAKFALDNNLITDPSEQDRLRTLLNSLDGGKNLPIKELAGRGAYNKLYLYYRILSHDAAHISARSLQRHLTIKDGGWTGFQWGPDEPKHVAETLNLGILVICGLGVALTQILNDGEGNQDFHRISEEHLLLQN